MPMPALPEDRCPRCGGRFHCGMGDHAPCACTGIQLDAALLQRLRERYTGCLCLHCLASLAQGEAIVPEGSCESPP
jgi:Cysteine-rich CWC